MYYLRVKLYDGGDGNRGKIWFWGQSVGSETYLLHHIFRITHLSGAYEHEMMGRQQQIFKKKTRIK